MTADEIDTEAATIARFESRCGLCGEAIEEGDEIVAVDDTWCHVECAWGDE